MLAIPKQIEFSLINKLFSSLHILLFIILRNTLKIPMR